MANDSVHYSLQDGIATIRIDDGKRNALSAELLVQIYRAFDRAEADSATVILTGRESVFSAGFDLHVMKKGGSNAIRMLRLGYSLPARVLAYPYPVVAACNGHSFAMGSFLMLSADYVIGSRGEFQIAANEVAIGLPMPRVAVAVLRNRLRPAAFQRAVTLAEHFDPDAAQAAGFLDDVVEPAELLASAEAHARKLLQLDMVAHTKTKRRVRKALIRRLRLSVPVDLLDAMLMGVRRARKK